MTPSTEQENILCKHCSKAFTSRDALQQHTKSKHPEQVKNSLFSASSKTKKRFRNFAIAGIILLLLAWWIFTSISSYQEENPLFVVALSDTSHIPSGSVHWHPKLTIIIDGKKQPIPTDIGVRIGRVVDTRLSEMGMSPTHTHENDGTIHLENLNPSSKPETTSLGYFFYAWKKTFNQNCIFEYCTDKGTLQMFVNGKEHMEFERYLMKDKDDIKIEYTTKNT